MANRSHLYAFDRFEAGMPLRPRGLHEWSGSIPISHLLMMSGKPRRYASLLSAHKVAIVADYEPGVTRFLAFLHALEASQALPAEFASDVRAAEQFLADDKAKGRFLLLEPVEIFAFSAKPDEEQCAKVVEKQIPALVAQVDEALGRPPAQLFVKAPKWLAAIKKDWTTADLGLGQWSSTLYYALDAEPA
ncbi:MAG: hypothetical protein H6Q90_5833 [Deltaproteobacteria bacterium]|nr:hypothetical protein [Deltaproteobacteria bacterium]